MLIFNFFLHWYDLNTVNFSRGDMESCFLSNPLSSLAPVIRLSFSLVLVTATGPDTGTNHRYASAVVRLCTERFPWPLQGWCCCCLFPADRQALQNFKTVAKTYGDLGNIAAYRSFPPSETCSVLRAYLFSSVLYPATTSLDWDIH